MIRRAARSLAGDESGAITPLYAVAILSLVAMAGIGFDYGRMVALDSELQNAADQAALAAATQLDGGDDAMIRARDAATNTFATAASAFVNETRFANDNAGRPIVDLGFRFYDGYADDAPGSEITSDSDGGDARVVEVTVNPRSVFYALTPLVGAFSDNAIGRAMASLETSTCNVPPVMFCLPSSSGVVDHAFPTTADIGKSLQLHIKKTNNSWPWAPGNFGFLDINYDVGGKDKTRSLGLNSDYLGCTGDAIETDPGNKDPQGDALNARIDEFSGSVKANDCNGDGDFCPSESVRKNLVMTETATVRVSPANPAVPPARPACGATSSPPNLTVSTAGPTSDTAVSSFRADTCIVNGSCNVLGDGVWDYTAYFNARRAGNAKYPAPTASDFGKTDMADVTRYDVYTWELADPDNRLQPELLPSSPAPTSRVQGGNRIWTFVNYCAYPQPRNASAVPASASQKDRRVLTVAAVDCTGLTGKGVVDIVRWVDVFMLEPVLTTGSDKEFRAEIIGPAQLAGGGSGFQYFGRKKAVLIR